MAPRRALRNIARFSDDDFDTFTQEVGSNRYFSAPAVVLHVNRQINRCLLLPSAPRLPTFERYARSLLESTGWEIAEPGLFCVRARLTLPKALCSPNGVDEFVTWYMESRLLSHVLVRYRA